MSCSRSSADSCSHGFIGSVVSTDDVCKECGSIVPSRELPENSASPRERTAIAKKRSPRRMPQVLRSKVVRKEYKVLMIATLPGVSRAKAQSVVDACEGSMARLVGASSTELARVKYKGVAIGMELGLAIWRALH